MKGNLLSFSEVTKIVPNRPSTSAIWRWCRKGQKSRSGEIIRLEHVRIGKKIYTSAESLHDYFKEMAQSDAKYFDGQKTFNHKKTNKTRTSDQKNKPITEAEERLKIDGFRKHNSD